jgi:DNA-binding response OmpR family regulator
MSDLRCSFNVSRETSFQKSEVLLCSAENLQHGRKHLYLLRSHKAILPPMTKPLDILLIEDDIDDVDLLKEALQDNGVNYNINVIMEGDKVSGYLDTVSNVPGVIVMDLNLPKADGKEILQAIKNSGSFLAVPIVVLSTSSSNEDMEYCYKMGIKQFITKPATIEGWNETIKTIVEAATE